MLLDLLTGAKPFHQLTRKRTLMSSLEYDAKLFLRLINFSRSSWTCPSKTPMLSSSSLLIAIMLVDGPVILPGFRKSFQRILHFIDVTLQDTSNSQKSTFTLIYIILCRRSAITQQTSATIMYVYNDCVYIVTHRGNRQIPFNRIGGRGSEHVTR